MLGSLWGDYSKLLSAEPRFSLESELGCQASVPQVPPPVGAVALVGVFWTGLHGSRSNQELRNLYPQPHFHNPHNAMQT